MDKPVKTIDSSLQVSITMTPKEYYNLRLLCLQYQVPFLVRWEKTGCIVTVESPFLIANGYGDLVDF